MECLAIIPARGGSKGIPRKNILPLAGQPLIAYNIEQARSAYLVNRVIVSTDDAEIGAVARKYGAEVVWRPAEISGDTASSEAALLHTLEYLRQSEGYVPDVLVFLQCTSPLTLAEDIDGTIRALEAESADTALAVIPFHYFLWREQSDEQGERQDRSVSQASGINHDPRLRPLRQQREPQYLETGAVYVMRVPGFLEARHRFFGKTSLYVMPAERRLEIDDPVDFQVAEVLMKAQRQEQARGYRAILRSLPAPLQALILDFDGVFTDDRVLVMEDGREAVTCSRSDGWGIGQLKKTGLPIVIFSTERNPVVHARAAKLGLPCYQGLADKGQALQNWLAENRLDPAQCIFVGNDANDLGCMQMVGCVVVPADAHPSVLPLADIVLQHSGGHGALRELCELILSQR